MNSIVFAKRKHIQHKMKYKLLLLILLLLVLLLMWFLVVVASWKYTPEQTCNEYRKPIKKYTLRINTKTMTEITSKHDIFINFRIIC